MARTGRGASPSRDSLVWAVDAQQCNERTVARVLDAVGEFAQRRRVQMEPVYVLTPDATSVPLDWFEQAIPRLRREAEQRFASLVESAPPTEIELAPLKVLVDMSRHVSRAIDRLNRHAMRSKAGAIVTMTQGRTGVERLFLGSFTESLLLHGKTQILAVTPRIERSRGRQRLILCPVDFGPAAEPVYKAVLDLASGDGSTLAVFHALPAPSRFTALLESMKPSKARKSPLLRDQEKREALMNRLVERARRRGIDAKAVITSANPSPSAAIVAAARAEGATLIAMSSHSSALRAEFAGSVTRQVVRAAPCPVLILPAQDR